MRNLSLWLYSTAGQWSALLLHTYPMELLHLVWAPPGSRSSSGKARRLSLTSPLPLHPPPPL